MNIKDINIYSDMDSWLEENPDTVIRGTVIGKGDGFIEIIDENGFTQVINLNKLFAIVY